MLKNSTDPVAPSPVDEGQEAVAVGSRVRELRQAHEMSQRKLAGLAGITNGAISMIEQNRVSPSIASLKKILEVFGLSLADFFAADFKPDTQFFYRAKDMTRIADGPVVLRQVGGSSSRRKLQVLHETYAMGGDTGPTMLSHEGEEAGVIVRGQIEITVAGQCEVLGAGDGYYFSSRLPHRFRNLGKEDCEIVSTCTPPTF
ncbi:MAG: cupin domain-containing protein [Planctomycetaceae bacterium]|nr:cupin domain-containing protein [Planctomycetaceae bacterium]MCB9938516.1 cupin domain-containing protein [Planctomycetaceae bacterium]HRX79517.1 cupin domain-containing protein [Pirellulaceae bacterium]